MENREIRVQNQLNEWLKGNPVHNTVDDECCPDFSCCTPELLASEEMRKTFYAANDEQRESMLYVFLGAAIANHTDKQVFIANGKDEIISENN